MTGLVDIHAHVLPGLDDGPATVSESIAMVEAAVFLGFDTLCTTPHLRADFPKVEVKELGLHLSRLGNATRHASSIRLVGAAEVSLEWALDASPAERRQASFGQFGRDLLVESPVGGARGLDRLLYALISAGYRITLAHPERTPDFQNHPHYLDSLVRQGVLLQVNAASILGGASPSRARTLARKLCTTGLAHIIASDAHRGHGWRPLDALVNAESELLTLVGARRAHWMTRLAPAAVATGSRLPPEPQPDGARPRGVRRFLNP